MTSDIVNPVSSSLLKKSMIPTDYEVFRVRHRTSVLNLAMIRRAVVSVAVHWIKKCRHRRKATMNGFFDFMSARQSQKALSLVTAYYSSWLPSS